MKIAVTLSVEAARAICAPYGVVIDATDPERLPRVEAPLADDEDVQRGVDRVAAAIDGIFAALR